MKTTTKGYRHASCDISRDGKYWAVRGHGQARRAPTLADAYVIAESLRDNSRADSGKGSSLRYHIDDANPGTRGVIAVEDDNGKAFAKIAWGEGSPIGYVLAEQVARQLAAHA